MRLIPPSTSQLHDTLPRSSGLGLATVRELLAHKAYIAIIDLSAPPDDLAQDRTRFFKADVAQTEEVARVVEECVAWTQKTGAILGGLINAAGIGSVAKVRTLRRVVCRLS